MTRKVSEREIIGTWRLETQSLDLLKRDGYVEKPGTAYTITFERDGALQFHSVIQGDSGGSYCDCRGHWTLLHDVTVDNETRRANAIDVQLDKADGEYCFKLSLSEESGRLRLWSFYGDPDSYEFMEYEKE